MKSNSVVRQELLRRKVQEYFAKKPKAKSAIFSLGEGNLKSVFKVVREGTSFRVIEVNTSSQEFLIEQPPGLPPPTSAPPQAGGGMPQQQPMGQTGAQQHNLAAYQQQDFSSKIGMLQGGLVPMTADTAAMAFADLLKPGVGRDVVTLRTTIEQGAASAPPEAKRALGSMLGALTVLSNQRSMMSAGKKNDGSVVAEKKKIVLEQEDDEDVRNPVGNSGTPPLEEPTGDGGLAGHAEKPEETFVNKSLEGHTIRSANIDVEPHGGSLTLDLVTTQNPAVLSWDTTGRVVFSFKGRKFLVQNGNKE